MIMHSLLPLPVNSFLDETSEICFHMETSLWDPVHSFSTYLLNTYKVLSLCQILRIQLWAGWPLRTVELPHTIGKGSL